MIQSSSRRMDQMFLKAEVIKAGGQSYFFAVFCLTLASLLSLPLTWYLSLLVGMVLLGQTQISSFYILLTLWVTLGLSRLFLIFVGERIAITVAAKVRVHLRHQLFSKLFSLGPAYLAQKESASLTTLLVEQVELLEPFVARYLPQLYVTAFSLPAIIFVMIFFSPFIALLLTLCAIMAPILMIVAGLAAHKKSIQQQETFSKLGGLFLDRMRHLETLRIFGAVEQEKKVLQTSSTLYHKKTMAVLRVAFLSGLSLDFLSVIALALGALHIMGLDVHAQNALFILLMISEFFAPLRKLLLSHHDRSNALAATAKIREVLMHADTTVSKMMGPHVSLPEPLWTPTIDLQNVSFTYTDRTIPALDKFSMHIEGGAFVVLSGPSGGGKSTVLSLLMGFIQPQSGLIAVGNCAIEQIHPQQRTQLFSWIGQNTRLMFGTLKENILFGLKTIDQAQLERALEQAGLTTIIESLPHGLETVVGENGFGLSGGQAQRVALARALLRQSPILLLDEPTAGLDEETTLDFLNCLLLLKGQRTILMVSHDLLAQQKAEKVIVLPYTQGETV